MAEQIKRDGMAIWCNDDVHYDQATMTLKRYTGPLGLVVDIGACIGGFSLCAAKMGAGRVIAYEPEHQTYPMLLENIENNGYTDTITVVKAGVIGGTRAKEVPLKMLNQGMASLIYADSQPYATNKTIKCLPFRDIMAILGEVDYLKIDVEGGEYSIADDYFFDILKTQVRFLDIEVHVMDNWFNQDNELIDYRYRDNPQAPQLLDTLIQRTGMTKIVSGRDDGAHIYTCYAKHPEDFASVV